MLLNLIYIYIYLVWVCLKFYSPTAESFGVSAKLGPGALWGSHPARFHEVPRFQVGVPSKGSGRFRGSQEGFEIKDSGGSKVPIKTF